MLKTRLIPVLLLKDGMLVRSEGFEVHQIIGDPLHEVKRFNAWNVDELIYLDISASGDRLPLLDAIAATCFMPLAFGGGVRRIDEMRAIFSGGADKVVLNSAAFDDPGLLNEAARTFGRQAIVVSIDVRAGVVVTHGGTTSTGLTPVAAAQQVAAAGAGEILLQSVERDGSARGYDTELIRSVAQAVNIPVIACSGVGDYSHFPAGIYAGAHAVAAANIWHFKELADRGAKRAMQAAGIDVRLDQKKTKT